MLIKGGSQVDGRSGHSLGHVLKLDENLKLKLDVIIYTCLDQNYSALVNAPRLMVTSATA